MVPLSLVALLLGNWVFSTDARAGKIKPPATAAPSGGGYQKANNNSDPGVDDFGTPGGDGPTVQTPPVATTPTNPNPATTPATTPQNQQQTAAAAQPAANPAQNTAPQTP